MKHLVIQILALVSILLSSAKAYADSLIGTTPGPSFSTMQVVEVDPLTGVSLVLFESAPNFQAGNTTAPVAVDELTGQVFVVYRDPADSFQNVLTTINADGSNSTIPINPVGLYAMVYGPSFDTDGDGLLDSWETDGIPYNDGDGIEQHYMLPNANPMHKDLYVEVDAMTGFSLSDDAVTLLETAFSAAPLINPDDVNGVTLHVQRDQTDLDHVEVWATDGCWPLGFNDIRDSNYGTVLEKEVELTAAKAKAYRYCIVADKADNPATKKVESIGGCGQMPGDNFVIFLGSGEYDDVAQAAVFMHELGHNLSLDHGGGDGFNGKPNYPSIMNYVLSYRYSWNSTFWRLDYSGEDAVNFNSLNETSLNEVAGIGTPSGLYSNFKMPFGVNELDGQDNTIRTIKYVFLNGSETDFGNTRGTMFQDNSIDNGVAQDLNFAVVPPPGDNVSLPGVSSFPQTLDPYDDWANVRLKLAAAMGDNAPAISYPADELTTDARDWINENFPLPPNACQADLDGDGTVNTSDLLELFAQWGTDGPADFDGSGAVGTSDLLILFANWGPCE